MAAEALFSLQGFVAQSIESIRQGQALDIRAEQQPPQDKRARGARAAAAAAAAEARATPRAAGGGRKAPGSASGRPEVGSPVPCCGCVRAAPVLTAVSSRLA